MNPGTYYAKVACPAVPTAANVSGAGWVQSGW